MNVRFKTKESALARALQKKWLDVFFVKLENLQMAGVPDLLLAKGGRTYFVELKSCIEPKKESSQLLKYGLNQMQLNFFLEFKRKGNFGFLLILTDKRLILLNSKNCDFDLINKASLKDILNYADFECLLNNQNCYNLLKERIFENEI